MKYRIYDSGEKHFDRYTMVYLDTRSPRTGFYDCFGMSDRPSHPQGFGQHSSCQLGRHLGKVITLDQLPDECQKMVKWLTTEEPA
jgi:hypothetical protein